MVSVGNLHNTRILRFILVLIVVILTIFIYASYSTTTTLTPTHMHAALAPPTPQQLTGVAGRMQHQQQQSEQLQAVVVINATGEFGLSTGEELLVGNNKFKQSESPRKPRHRLPTIDEDALLDGGAGGASPMAGSEQAPNVADELLEEQQYVQNADAITGNINTNNNNSDSLIAKQPAVAAAAAIAPAAQQQQSPSDAEILMIPTSNLQKFIENADKILKNMTTSSSNPAASLPSTDKTNQPNLVDDVQINLLDNNNAVAPAAASYSVMHTQSDAEESKDKVLPPKPPVPKVKSKSKGPIIPMDPSKGIATEKIYESGHLNDEINVERICPQNGINTRLLILITSAITHADARMSIRQTWGHYGSRRDIGMAFVLGRGTNETVNQLLSQENYMYGDLIRGMFIDSYNNLTLKTISSLEWADQHCHQAKYILKTDDDMFINVPKLLNFLKQLEKHKQKPVILGRLAKKWKPIRNKKSKYYVSTDQFPASVFPSFTTGPAYVMTRDIVHDLYVRSLQTVYLKLEDVFTTGIVAQSLGIERLHVNEFVNRRISFNPCNIRNAISVHMIKSNEQFDLWKKLLDQTTKSNKERRSVYEPVRVFLLHKKKKKKLPLPIISYPDTAVMDKRVIASTKVPLRNDPYLGKPAPITRLLYDHGHSNNQIYVERICPLYGLKIRILIIVTSAPPHALQRMAIRQTWARNHTEFHVGFAFLLGRSLNNTLNEQLDIENYVFGDLIRGNNIDSYYNLTLKSISLLEWVDQYCPGVKYIMKTDDDVFINVPILMDFLNRIEMFHISHAILGKVIKKGRPVRYVKSKYFVSTREYMGLYPSFATGPAYVLTGNVVHDLFVQSLQTPYLKFEDVFVTGVVAEKLGIERLHFIQFYNGNVKKRQYKPIDNIISYHEIRPKYQFYMYNYLHGINETTTII